MLRKFIWYLKSIFRFIRPSMCISKRIKWIKKKATMKNFFFAFFFQSPHQVDMKNVVECPREFIAYFNALETTCADALHSFATLSKIGHAFRIKLVQKFKLPNNNFNKQCAPKPIFLILKKMRMIFDLES